MSSTKGKLVRLFGGFVLREARVVAAEAPSAGFRLLRLAGDALRAEAGNKVQILLASDDVRTYTPIQTRDGVDLLGWCHAGGPGARWVSDAKLGDTIRYMGVQASLALPEGPVILVGDETSVAVAASFEVARPGQVQAIFEAASPEDLQRAATAVGIQRAHVASRRDVAAVVDAVQKAREKAPGAAIALTGGSELVVATRTALRERGVGPIKAKAYWAPGKTGLD